MDDRILFQFESAGKTLDVMLPNYSILDYEGIESTDYDIISNENVNNYGSTKKKIKILERQIMLEFAYLGRDKLAKREWLISFFSPYKAGILKVTYLGITRQIEYEVSSFKFKSKALIEPPTALLYIKCMDPAFQPAVHYGEKILVLIGGWNWKFTLPFRMKQFGELKKNIHVGGDLETPVEIYFRGPADNPVVKNHRTGEYLKLNRNLTSDDTLYINTAYRKKTVEIIREGEREDAWDYLDFSSKFFWLYPGDNLIEYSGSDDSKKSKGAEIYYRERYLGV